jgi:hypothetical protein
MSPAVRATDHAGRVANIAALYLRRSRQACHKLVAKCPRSSQRSEINLEGSKIMKKVMKALFFDSPVFVIPPLRWPQSGEWPKGSGDKIGLLPPVVLAETLEWEAIAEDW